MDLMVGSSTILICMVAILLQKLLINLMNSEKFVDEDFVKFIELSPTIIMGSTMHDFLPLPYMWLKATKLHIKQLSQSSSYS